MKDVISEIIRLYLASDDDTKQQIRDVLAYLEALSDSQV